MKGTNVFESNNELVLVLHQLVKEEFISGKRKIASGSYGNVYQATLTHTDGRGREQLCLIVRRKRAVAAWPGRFGVVSYNLFMLL
jgi:hypothetical protein